MGVSKAALEAVARYLARDLGPRGVRVNLVASGPLGTVAASGIPGFERLASAWAGRRRSGGTPATPRRWPRRSASCSPTPRAASRARSCADGGFHAMGTPARDP